MATFAAWPRWGAAAGQPWSARAAAATHGAALTHFGSQCVHQCVQQVLEGINSVEGCTGVKYQVCKQALSGGDSAFLGHRPPASCMCACVQVAETLPAEVLEKMKALPKADDPIMTPDLLPTFDGERSTQRGWAPPLAGCPHPQQLQQPDCRHRLSRLGEAAAAATANDSSAPPPPPPPLPPPPPPLQG